MRPEVAMRLWIARNLFSCISVVVMLTSTFLTDQDRAGLGSESLP